MSTTLTPLERYQRLLTTHVSGRPLCRGWSGKIDKYGTAHFTWTEDGKHKSGNAARWLWQYHRGALTRDQALKNTCGWSVCQRLDHWTVIDRKQGLTPAERYENFVDRSGGPEACHPWTGALDKDGYGIFSYREGGPSITRRAQRFGWELVRDPLPADVLVCHTCDNPPCQNAAHWFIGAVADNNADKVMKGRERYASGETHHRAILTDTQITEARGKYTGQRGQIAALAREYGIHRRSMGHILHGERRKTV